MNNTPFEKETIEMFDKIIGIIPDSATMEKYGREFCIMCGHSTKKDITIKKLKTLFLSRLHALSAKHRKEIVEALEKLHEHEIKGLKINRNDVATIPDRYAKGYNNAVEDAKKLLEKITKHENKMQMW